MAILKFIKFENDLGDWCEVGLDYSTSSKFGGFVYNDSVSGEGKTLLDLEKICRHVYEVIKRDDLSYDKYRGLIGTWISRVLRSQKYDMVLNLDEDIIGR